MAHPPTISVRDVPECSRYEIEEDGARVGMLAYFLSDDGEMSLVHAEIEPARGGRGLGTALTRAALRDARARGLKVRPLCPFVVEHIARNPREYEDILA